MCGNEKKGNKKKIALGAALSDRKQTIAYYQCWVQAKMFAQTFDDLFSIKENRDNCLEVPQSWKREHKCTEKLAFRPCTEKNFLFFTQTKKRKITHAGCCTNQQGGASHRFVEAFVEF